MRRSWISLLVGAALLLPAAVRAQDQEVTVAAVGGRPRIGVMVDMQASAADNKLGATVKAVTPDGPAAKAGLKAGDIITKFNGTALGGTAPGQKLVELASALSPGDTVKAEYRRGTANRTATIVAADLGGSAFAWTTDRDENRMVQLAPLMEGRARAMRDRDFAALDSDRMMEEMNKQFHVRIGGGGAFGLELADMNAGLGAYFGTSKGVLVLENPSDSTMPLKAGDVIVAIDGREPATVGQARRILGSYDSGDVAKFELMRMKKKTTVSWKVPARSEMDLPGGMHWRTQVDPDAPGMPGEARKIRVMVTPDGPARPMMIHEAPAPPPPGS